MLSRNAHGLYWIGRYMERAGFVSRLVANQLQAMQDRPVEDIDIGWRRLYSVLGSKPVGGQLHPNLGEEKIMLADVYTLTDDLVFELSNPDAVLSCFATARENARQIRNNITHEMWTCLNVSYLDMRDTRLLDIWNQNPEDFLVKAALAVRTFLGIADNTMYRDHGWHFFQLGLRLERAINTTSLLKSHIQLFPTAEKHQEWNWSSLLSICEVRSVFRHLHTIQFRPDDIVEFLMADQLLPISARSALAHIRHALSELAGGHLEEGVGPDAHALHVRTLLDHQWPARDVADDSQTLELVDQAHHRFGCIHHELERAYFFYEINDMPPI